MVVQGLALGEVLGCTHANLAEVETLLSRGLWSRFGLAEKGLIKIKDSLEKYDSYKTKLAEKLEKTVGKYEVIVDVIKF